MYWGTAAKQPRLAASAGICTVGDSITIRSPPLPTTTSVSCYSTVLHITALSFMTSLPSHECNKHYICLLKNTDQAKSTIWNNHHHTPQPFYGLFWDHPGEPVPEEYFWTLWCKGRLTEADTWTIRLGATSSGLTSPHLHHAPIFFTGRMPFLPPNQQRQSTEGN